MKKGQANLAAGEVFFTETVIPEKERGLSFLLLDSFQQINLRRLISLWGISGMGVKGLRRLGVAVDIPYRFAASGLLSARRTVWTEGAAQRIKLFGLDNG